MERSQNNSRDSTASQQSQRRRGSGSRRPSSLKDKEAILNAVFNAPRPEEEVATDQKESRDEGLSHV